MKPGDRVLIVSEIEDLYNKDWAVDETAVAWIHQAVMMKGGDASVLWIDEPPKLHAWRFNPVLKAAMLGCDILINHSLNLVAEEFAEFRAYFHDHKIKMVRNYASTAPLLCSYWAQTPYELVSEIRHQSSLDVIPGLPYILKDENGTHLEGTIIEAMGDQKAGSGVPGMPYTSRRHDAGYYLPWPEWVHPPIHIKDTNGTCTFSYMLSWWSRYIGISPYFDDPITLTIKNNRITKIEGKKEAEALKRFLDDMEKRVGDATWDFPAFHHGVHPQAHVGAQQCPNINMRRTIDHSNTCNIHVHLGAVGSTKNYPYWTHITGDLRKPTFKVGDKFIIDNGHLTALDSPAVKAVADRYPGRPGVEPMPVSF